jgi:hypothetical protein
MAPPPSPAASRRCPRIPRKLFGADDMDLLAAALKAFLET